MKLIDQVLTTICCFRFYWSTIQSVQGSYCIVVPCSLPRLGSKLHCGLAFSCSIIKFVAICSVRAMIITEESSRSIIMGTNQSYWVNCTLLLFCNNTSLCNAVSNTSWQCWGEPIKIISFWGMFLAFSLESNKPKRNWMLAIFLNNLLMATVDTCPLSYPSSNSFPKTVVTVYINGYLFVIAFIINGNNNTI